MCIIFSHRWHLPGIYQKNTIQVFLTIFSIVVCVINSIKNEFFKLKRGRPTPKWEKVPIWLQLGLLTKFYLLLKPNFGTPLAQNHLCFIPPLNSSIPHIPHPPSNNCKIYNCIFLRNPDITEHYLNQTIAHDDS